MTKKQYITTLPKDIQEKILKNINIQRRESILAVEHLDHYNTIAGLFIWNQTDASLEGYKFWSDFANKRIQTNFTFSLI